MKKKLFFIMCVIATMLLAVVGLTGCGGTSVESVSIGGESSFELAINETRQLQATVQPDNAPSGVSWSSSNTAIATVTHNGLVTAISAGNATIAVTTDDGNHTASVAVTVSDFAVISIDVGTEFILPRGVARNLVAYVRGVPSQNVFWTSTDSSVVVVGASNGRVEGITYGVATVTAVTLDGAYLAQVQITVVPYVGFQSVAVYMNGEPVTRGGTITIPAGSESEFVAVLYPADTSSQVLYWRPGNSQILSFADNSIGNAVATSTGFVANTARATALDLFVGRTAVGTSDFNFTVNVVLPVTGVSLAGSASSAVVTAETATLFAQVLPQNATNQALIWYSSNPEVAEMMFENASELILHKVGHTYITVTTACGGFTDTIRFEVTPHIPVTRVEILGDEYLDMVAHDTRQLWATVVPAFATDHTITWASDNPSVATITEEGLVRAEGRGTAIITAKSACEFSDDAETHSITITVTQPYPSQISFNDDTITLYRGIPNYLNLRSYVTVGPANAIPEYKIVEWELLDNGVNYFDINASTGILTALGTQGTATIQATLLVYPYPSATATVTISHFPEPPMGIAIVTVQDFLNIGNTAIFGPNAMSLTYYLMNDIDFGLTTAVATASAISNINSFGVLGGVGTTFDGTLDGRGFSVKNFRVYRMGYANGGGLFYHLNGTIRNIGFENFSMIDTGRVNGFIATVAHGNARIENIYIYNGRFNHSPSAAWAGTRHGWQAGLGSRPGLLFGTIVGAPTIRNIVADFHDVDARTFLIAHNPGSVVVENVFFVANNIRVNSAGMQERATRDLPAGAFAMSASNARFSNVQTFMTAQLAQQNFSALPSAQWVLGAGQLPRLRRLETNLVVPITQINIADVTGVEIVGGTDIAIPLSRTLRVNLEPYYASARQVYWTSSNPQYIAVDRYTGVITAVAEGTSTITARAINQPAIYAEISVEAVVREYAVQSLDLPSAIRIVNGVSGVSNTFTFGQNLATPNYANAWIDWIFCTPNIVRVGNNNTTMGLFGAIVTPIANGGVVTATATVRGTSIYATTQIRVEDFTGTRSIGLSYASDFDWIHSNLNRNFHLTRNIDFGGEQVGHPDHRGNAVGGVRLVGNVGHIGTEYGGPATGTAAIFTGVLDGRGFAMTNFSMTRNSGVATTNSGGGLFNQLSGTVRNLGFIDFDFHVTYQAAGLIAGDVLAGAIIENIYIRDGNFTAPGDGGIGDDRPQYNYRFRSGGVLVGRMNNIGSIVRNIVADVSAQTSIGLIGASSNTTAQSYSNLFYIKDNLMEVSAGSRVYDTFPMGAFISAREGDLDHNASTWTNAYTFYREDIAEQYFGALPSGYWDICTDGTRLPQLRWLDVAVSVTNPDNITVVQGNPYRLPITVDVLYGDGITRPRDIVWTHSIDTSEPNVFTVTGEIYEMSVSFQVIVIARIYAEDVSIEGDSIIDLEAGERRQLVAVFTPYNASVVDVVWSSSNETVATVDQNGVISARSEGTAIITVTALHGSGITETVTVNVEGGQILAELRVEFEQGDIILVTGMTQEEFYQAVTDALKVSAMCGQGNEYFGDININYTNFDTSDWNAPGERTITVSIVNALGETITAQFTAYIAFAVRTEADLRAINDHIDLETNRLDTTIFLMNNIALTTAFNTPIGATGVSGNVTGIPFTGVFDGNGFSITNINGIPPGNATGILFFNIGEGGVVRNLGIVTVAGANGANANGRHNIALLAHTNNGLIKNVFAMGAIRTGNNNLAGLVNTNGATGIIRNSFSTVRVVRTGGETAQRTRAIARNNNAGGQITNVFVDGTVSEKVRILDGANPALDANILPTAQMQDPATFRNAGWDENIWYLANGAYPQLRPNSSI